MPNNKFYSIAEITELTGATEFLLRTWELRYGLVKPKRTDTGRRIYSPQDVLKISKIVSLTQRGFRVGKLARLNLDELNLLETMETEAQASDPGAPASENVNQVFSLLAKTDWEAIKEIFVDEKKKTKNLDYIQRFILPVCQELSARSYSQTIDIIQEHILTSLIKESLWALPVSNAINKPRYLFVFATTEGDHHDLGLLISKIIADSLGFKTLYLGAHVPKKELIEACIKLKPTHLVVSSSLIGQEYTPETFLKYAGFLDQHLPSNIALWLGGTSVQDMSLNLKRSFAVHKTMESFKECLAAL